MAWISPALQKLRDTGEFSRLVEEHLAEPPPARTARDFVTLGLILLGFLGLSGLGFLAWNRSLLAQVEVRTKQIAEAAAEKERLAQNLADRDQRMRMVVEQMPAILWSTDRALNITSVSGLGLKTLGVEAARVQGAPVEKALEDLGLSGTTVLAQLKQGLLGQASDVQVRISGREVEVHIEPLRDSSGAVSGLVGVTVDVAERTRTARALRESEERYRTFVEHSSEGIWRWEFKEPWPVGAPVDAQLEHFFKNAYVAECNDAVARLYGMEHARDMVGLTYSQVREILPLPASGDHFRAFIASGYKSTTWEAPFLDLRGVPRWSSVTVVGIMEEGIPRRAWVTQVDISLRKKAEKELHRTHQLVASTLESTADGILVVGSGGELLAWNENFVTTWNLPPDILAKRRDEQAMAAVLDQLSDPEGFVKGVHELYANPERESLDQISLKDGRILERFSRPLGVRGEIEGRVFSFRDITEREHALREVRESNRLLEIKNAELERFTYTVSHDLRSPLITIRGYLGHLEMSFIEGNLHRFRDDAKRIDRAASKMENLLRDLLELSRIGRVLNPEEDVSMSVVAQDAADLVRGPLLHRGVRLEIDEALPVVHGDRQRLTEVVQNLLENAVKFMGSQTVPRVRIDARRDDGSVAFQVRDNGIGIDPRHREKVFGLFEKLSPGGEGTGVGLALAKRIIEAHGGRIWVESEGLGLGSTFCFTLKTVD